MAYEYELWKIKPSTEAQPDFEVGDRLCGNDYLPDLLTWAKLNIHRDHWDLFEVSRYRETKRNLASVLAWELKNPDSPFIGLISIPEDFPNPESFRTAILEELNPSTAKPKKVNEGYIYPDQLTKEEYLAEFRKMVGEAPEYNSEAGRFFLDSLGYTTDDIAGNRQYNFNKLWWVYHVGAIRTGFTEEGYRRNP